MSDTKEQQQLFFERLRKLTESERDVAGQVATVLNLNRSSVYKRMRGEVPMKMHEAELIAEHFKIPYHQLQDVPAKVGVPFLSTGFLATLADVRSYLIQTDKLIDVSVEGPKVLYYSARDLPLFWYFATPNLIRFKLGVWLSSFSGDDQFFLAYKRSQEVDEILDLASQLFERYLSIHTVELWTKRTVVNMLNQIAVYFHGGRISREEALQLSYDVQTILSQVRVSAQQGHKRRDGKYDFYHVDFLMMTNSALYKTQKQRTGFISYAGINYLSTQQDSFCRDLERWFKVQMDNAVLLSHGTKFQSQAFFTDAELKVRELIRTIDSNLNPG